jgi:uncharacterized membrane protein YkvA (DUF1232 family)
MTSLTWLTAGAGVVLAVYAAFVVALMVAGRRDDARALAGFIPDCIVLVRRLLGDAGVPRRHKWLLGGLVAYLALPVDLVPDFIPVAGQLDDVIVVAAVLRVVLRASGPTRLHAHWPGPASSLAVLLRLIGAPAEQPRHQAPGVSTVPPDRPSPITRAP